MMKLLERKASDKQSLQKFNLNQVQRTLSNNLGRWYLFFKKGDSEK